MNLGTHCGDDPQNVRQNRHLLQTCLPSEVTWLNQVHGTNVLELDRNFDPVPTADAVTSSRVGQICAVLTADCLPVLFCNKAGTKVAAAHAGWRGLAAGVLEATVSAMDCEPSELLAWMGPAIGAEAFEVGADVWDVFAGTIPESKTAFKPKGDRWLANLYHLARLRLARAGIAAVSGGQYCTWAEKDKFFSYRRDGKTGRMATLVWLVTTDKNF